MDQVGHLKFQAESMKPFTTVNTEHTTAAAQCEG
jgi:hypothetical protein